MPAYLLTWNPSNWPWESLDEDYEIFLKAGDLDMRWSSGSRRELPIGSRVYLLRQGIEPRGIVGSGWTDAEPAPEPHWDPVRASAGDIAYYVRFKFDVLLHPGRQSPLDVRHLPSGPVQQVNWIPYGSGQELPDDAAAQLEQIWLRFTDDEPSGLGVVADVLEGLEGEVRLGLVHHRRRERSLRNAKLEQARAESSDGRIKCQVPHCGFDFQTVYGQLGERFAEVHHLTPLADTVGRVRTRLEDLAVVCSNCHSMIHRGGKSRPLDSLTVRRS
jgi:hypothetical protein